MRMWPWMLMSLALGCASRGATPIIAASPHIEAAPPYVGTVPLRVTRNTYAETPPETTYLLLAGDREAWPCRDAMARSMSGTLGQPCEPFAVAVSIEPRS